MNKKLSQEQLAIKLARISFALWIISLGLVGFSFLNGINWRGIEILFWGILGGWMSAYHFTAYSNIFYLAVMKKILEGKKPVKSVIIMGLLAFLLLFGMSSELKVNSSLNFGSFPEHPVMSWGWGAILLLFSQALMVIAALARHGLYFKSCCVLIGLSILPLIGVGTFGTYQRIKANEWEIEHYFPTYDIAFTKQSLSGLPSKSLTEKLSDEETIEIEFIGDIPPLITENEDAYPKSYWQNGRFWKKYYAGNIFDYFSIATESTKKPTHYLTVTNPKAGYFLYTLYQRDNDKVIYQQPVKTIKNRWGENSTLPSLHLLYNEIWHIKKREEKTLLWQSEKGQESCIVKKIATDGLSEIWQLDNHQIRIFNYDDDRSKIVSDFYPELALCSENYLLAFRHEKIHASNTSVYNAWLFERKTGVPVATFESNYDLQLVKPVVTQFELVVLEHKTGERNKSYLILHTNRNDATLELSERQREIYQ